MTTLNNINRQNISLVHTNNREIIRNEVNLHINVYCIVYKTKLKTDEQFSNLKCKYLFNEKN